MKRSNKMSPTQAKVFDHIRELQIRLIVSLAVLVLAGIVVYFYYEPVLDLLRSPLGGPLYYTTPAGSFAFVMKICFMGALAVTIPVIVYNLIMFARPAFEKSLPLRRVYLTTLFSAILAFSGAAFGFVFIIPGALNFFQGFELEGLSALISADSYLTFVTSVIITFVIVFQLPLLISFIDSVKPIPPKRLLKMEKWVILGSLIVSLLVPFALDITTSLLIALPIIVLYNLSIVIVVMRSIQRKRVATRMSRREAKRTARASKLLPAMATGLNVDALDFENLTSDRDRSAVISPQPAPILRQQPTITKPQPVITQVLPNPVIVTNLRQSRTVMDIKPLHARPPMPAPRPTIQRSVIAQQPTVSPRMNLISDMRGPRTNRVLT